MFVECVTHRQKKKPLKSQKANGVENNVRGQHMSLGSLKFLLVRFVHEIADRDELERYPQKTMYQADSPVLSIVKNHNSGRTDRNTATRKL